MKGMAVTDHGNMFGIKEFFNTVNKVNGDNAKKVKTAKNGNGLIYNLAGQRVDNSYKGLVIKNGKKLVQK